MRHLATGHRTKWNQSQSSGIRWTQEARDLVKSGAGCGGEWGARIGTSFVITIDQRSTSKWAWMPRVT